jgi:hypothetical protein
MNEDREREFWERMNDAADRAEDMAKADRILSRVQRDTDRPGELDESYRRWEWDP